MPIINYNTGGSMVNPPNVFMYDNSLQLLRWQEQAGATGYLIELSNDGDVFDKIYEGPDDCCNIELKPGTYYLRGITQNKPDSSMSVPVSLTVQ